MTRRQLTTAALALLVALPTDALRGGENEGPATATELAKKLSNPVANLIQVPVQNNWDFGIGETNAMRFTANIQPVVPFSISEDWNLVTRTVLPVIHAESPTVGGSAKSGLGDTSQTFLFSPKLTTGDGWIWGAGPVFILPTAADSALGAGKWCVGPTAVLLRQKRGWTYGLLANHVWSYAGDRNRIERNSTFLNPFLNYTNKKLTTYGINLESTYDWTRSQWTVPVNVSVSQLLKFGAQTVSIGAGIRYYADAPVGGPDWGTRFTVAFLFPK